MFRNSEPPEDMLSSSFCFSVLFPPPPLDQSPTGAAPSQHKSSVSSFSSCCSVAESRAEIKAMLDDFQVGLNRMLSSNLQEPLVVSPPDTRNSCNSAKTGSNTWGTSPKCSHCSEYIISLRDVWYSCSDCGVVCKTCHRKIRDYCPKAPSPKSIKYPASFVPSTNSITPEHRNPVLNSDSSRPVVHAGIVCSACSKTIHGVRHKCLDCRDYYLCTQCITTGVAERHNPFHEFYEIREPGRVVSGARNNSLVVHPAACNLCDSGITGDRYKCAICPNFDTCSSCFAITNDQHPNHSFIKITKREDIIHRKVEPLAIHSASCNVCKQTIHGNRFKCMHPGCPEYDLCQNCEALPIAVHPADHPMLKIKTPFTAIPIVHRHGQDSHISGSITSTHLFTGSRTSNDPQFLESEQPECEPSADVSAVLARIVNELPSPPLLSSAEAGFTTSRISLSAAFVENVSVPDGHVFPPGAEFIKSWRMINDSGCEWPESTELVFLAGDSLSASASVENEIAVPIGKVGPGETSDVSTGELKAPEVAGRYVGYWRLRADGTLFGNSIWVDINVEAEESMASSPVIMPAASSAPHNERISSIIATTLSNSDDNLSDAGSDVSLISIPSSPSDDEVWHSTLSNLSKVPATVPGSSAAPTPAAVKTDYVVLYDDESSDEER